MIAGKLSTRGLAVLRLLLNNYRSNSFDAMIKFLPKDEEEAISNLDLSSAHLEDIFRFKESFLKRVHYSWLVPVLKEIPNELHPVLGGFFSSEQLEGLSRVLGKDFKHGESTVLPVLKDYLMGHLFSFFARTNILPVNWLAESRLSRLLLLNKRQLVQTIDFLGLHDLAKELPLVLDKNVHNSVYSVLSKMQIHYLKSCFKSRDRAPFPKINLLGWEGDREKLSEIVHYRGLMRFAMAISQEDPMFIWYICHILDKGRAQQIHRILQKRGDFTDSGSYFISQVNDLLEFFTKRDYAKTKR